jgi:hypothetical protein
MAKKTAPMTTALTIVSFESEHNKKSARHQEKIKLGANLRNNFHIKGIH